MSTSGLAPSGLGWPQAEVGERTTDDAEGLGWPGTGSGSAPGKASVSGTASDSTLPGAVTGHEEWVSRETSPADSPRGSTVGNAFERGPASAATTMAVAEAALAETAGWAATSSTGDHSTDPDHGSVATAAAHPNVPPVVPRETSPGETPITAVSQTPLGHADSSLTHAVADPSVPRETSPRAQSWVGPEASVGDAPACPVQTRSRTWTFHVKHGLSPLPSNRFGGP